MGDHHVKRKKRPGLWALAMIVVVVAVLIYVTTKVSAPDPAPEPLTAPQTTADVPASSSPPPVLMDATGCSLDQYGGVTERVRDVGHYLAKRFKITKVVGKTTGVTDASDHAVGLALDFYFVDKESGDDFARYLSLRQSVLDINYIAWWDRAYIGGEWVTMTNDGSEHNYDHVHVSFRANPEHALTCE